MWIASGKVGNADPDAARVFEAVTKMKILDGEAMVVLAQAVHPRIPGGRTYSWAVETVLEAGTSARHDCCVTIKCLPRVLLGICLHLSSALPSAELFRWARSTRALRQFSRIYHCPSNRRLLCVQVHMMSTYYLVLAPCNPRRFRFDRLVLIYHRTARLVAQSRSQSRSAVAAIVLAAVVLEEAQALRVEGLGKLDNLGKLGRLDMGKVLQLAVLLHTVALVEVGELVIADVEGDLTAQKAPVLEASPPAEEASLPRIVL